MVTVSSPSSLARYIAISAFLIRVSPSAPSSGKMLMPMHVPMNKSCSGMTKGWAKASMILRATRTAS